LGDLNLDYNKLRSTDYGLARGKRPPEAGIMGHREEHIRINTRRRLVKLQDGTTRAENSCLDHIYGPTNDLIKYDILNLPSSDHDAVVAKLRVQRLQFTEKQKSRSTTNNIYDLFATDPELYQYLANLQHMNNAQTLETGINVIHKYVLDKLCPFRVYTIRRDDYIVDNKDEMLKKKRDRFLKAFKKMD